MAYYTLRTPKDTLYGVEMVGMMFVCMQMEPSGA